MTSTGDQGFKNVICTLLRVSSLWSHGRYLRRTFVTGKDAAGTASLRDAQSQPHTCKTLSTGLV